MSCLQLKVKCWECETPSGFGRSVGGSNESRVHFRDRKPRGAQEATNVILNLEIMKLLGFRSELSNIGKFMWYDLLVLYDWSKESWGEVRGGELRMVVDMGDW